MVIPALNEALTTCTYIQKSERKAFEKSDINSAVDLILRLPRKYIDRSCARALINYRDGEVCTVTRVVAHHYRQLGRGRHLVIEIADESTHAELVCYGREKIKYLLPRGKRISIAASFEYRHGALQTTQFEFEPYPLIDIPEVERGYYSRFNAIIPLYTVPSELKQQGYFRLVRYLLASMSTENSSLASATESLSEYVAPGIMAALRSVHAPQNTEEIEQGRAALARHELLAVQLTLQQGMSAKERTRTDTPRLPSAQDIKAIIESYSISLPFSLTSGQEHALGALYHDIFSARAMKRLLQGDVGVGKTLVALLAMIPLLKEGYQIAFMVPTELLAHQQSKSARTLFAECNIEIITFDGSLSARERAACLEKIAAGEAQVIIGTHALFSADVNFKALGMIIVDEQHRFGVEQRVALAEKALQSSGVVHQLYMTATPIPRTLALALYSGFDVTTIHEYPQGRKKVITRLVAQRNEERVYRAVREELCKKHRAYFVYPLIEDNLSHVRSATEMAALLTRDVFPEYHVACIHSKIDEEEKRACMEKFAQGAIDILVATSVIEVGVDVPDATCIVINNAERFGLATLHQLRGRVGRSELQSYAFLIYQDSMPLSDDAKSRLKVLYGEHDGFAISEADLFIRGPGDLTGLKQSGASQLRVAHFPRHLSLLKEARLRAQEILARYPTRDSLPPAINDIVEFFA